MPEVALVRFFGGDLPEVSFSHKREKSKLLIINVYISLIIHSFQIFVKNMSSIKFATSYIKSMRENMINNFLNLYNSKGMIIVFSLGIFLEFFLLSFGESEGKYILSLSYHTVVFIMTSLPYRGYPLR